MKSITEIIRQKFVEGYSNGAFTLGSFANEHKIPQSSLSDFINPEILADMGGKNLTKVARGLGMTSIDLDAN